MKTLLFIATLLTLNTSFAKSLECGEGPSFTGRDFTINRDGAIGFNGSYITMNSNSGYWGDKYLNLSQITGRATDADLSLTGLVLAISPKESCTHSNADVQAAFKCSAKNVTIIATGEGTKFDPKSPIFDRIKLSSQIETAEVEVELSEVTKNNGTDTRTLHGTVKALGKTIPFEVPVRDVQADCKETSI